MNPAVSGPLEALLVAADRPVSEASGGVVADVPPDLKSQVVKGASAHNQDGGRQGQLFFAADRRKLGCAHNLNGPARARECVSLCAGIDSRYRVDGTGRGLSSVRYRPVESVYV